MEIKNISNREEIRQLLEEFSSSFIPSLEERVDDLDAYAEKLSINAINLVLLVENEIIGFICFYANNLESRKAYISLICIKREFQKRGYATLLLEKMFELCKDTMNCVELEVYSKNKKAVDFYKKNGFSKTERKSIDSDTFYMQRHL